MRSLKFTMICSLLAMLICAGCSKESEFSPPPKSVLMSDECSDEMMVLGEEINDPYKFSNMHQALADLAKGGEIPVTNITANYKYVRILPADENQLNLLEQDTNLLLWSYPLNREIVSNGSYYHDPSIPDSDITWQYCVVPKQYQFPSGLIIQDIYDVFIPPTEGDNARFYSALEDKAFEIAGIEDDNDEISESKGAEWTPSATIKAYDDIVSSLIPLEGIVVRARFFTNIAKATTNQSGYCQMPKKFKKKVNYSFKWDRAYWDLRNGTFGQAFYNGPQLKSHWNLNIYKTSGKSILYATVHRACMKFYYGNCLGVKRPILPDSKTKIAVYNNTSNLGSGCCLGTWSEYGIIPDIWIVHPTYRSTEKVFSTTIHELAHQSHLLYMGLTTYIQLAKEIHESWASAVAFELSKHHYEVELNSSYKFSYKNYQGWAPKQLDNGKTSCYTPLFIDLIDDNNQGKADIIYPNDLISGYTLQYIQDNILPTSFGLTSLRTALKAHKINGVTDDAIDELLKLYWGQDYARP